MKANTSWFIWLLLLGIIVASTLIITAPNVPWWGDRHAFDASKGAVRLNPDKSVAQMFINEAGILDTIVVWLDPVRLPSQGYVTLRVTSGEASNSRDVTVALAHIPPSGTAAFSLPQPLHLKKGAPATFELHLSETRQPVYVFFQIDGSIYPDGELAHRAGDLGFQVRYLRPPLGARAYHWLYGSMLLAAGIMSAGVLRAALRQQSSSRNFRRDTVIALVVGLGVAAWHGSMILRSGTWIGPGDFVKDVASVQASVDALGSGAWPVWSHLICGGLPLLANPESNTLSLATVLAFFLPSEQALLLLLAIEAGIGAIGTYLLARSFRAGPLGSFLAAAIAALSPAYAYRISEGFSMTGGAVALTPWVLLGFFHAVRNQRWWGVLMAGVGLGLIFWRGEVHIIVGVIMLLGLWTLLDLITQRSWRALYVLAGIGAVAFVWASPKLLAYGEHAALFTSNLKPYVVHLADMGLLDDVFLNVHDRDFRVAVRYGTQEHWGNFGTYTGWLPWILGMIGLVSPAPRRWWLLIGSASLLLVAEGAAFDYLLRPLGPLGVLLRLPTRLLSIFLVLLGILAGLGITTIHRRWKFPGRVIAGLLTAAIMVNLALATQHVLRDNFSHHSSHLPAPAAGAELAAHRNAAEDPTQHPGLLLKSNYLLPNLCADLNVDHPFTYDQPPRYPLTSVPAQVAPNSITLAAPAVTQDLYINENFIASWVADHGVVLESPAKSLHLLTPPEPYANITIRVVSGLMRSQQVLLLVLLAATVGGLIHLVGRFRRRAAAPGKPEPGPDHTSW